MLTPILTCAMPFCPMKGAQAAEAKPCHQSKDSKKSGPMMALDCMGVDLFQPSLQADVPQPDTSVDVIHFVWADLTADYGFQPVDIHGIRGPPDWAGRTPGQPSLILTTQRFRI
ncbi:MAG: hypothetical protein H6861_03465 [Rhodospirillales bacterium]|nr:hypothetical protein [Rhodospirillales bacterium]